MLAEVLHSRQLSRYRYKSHLSEELFLLVTPQYLSGEQQRTHAENSQYSMHTLTAKYTLYDVDNSQNQNIRASRGKEEFKAIEKLTTLWYLIILDLK